jgi:hypothetical protein
MALADGGVTYFTLCSAGDLGARPARNGETESDSPNSIPQSLGKAWGTFPMQHNADGL